MRRTKGWIALLLFACAGANALGQTATIENLGWLDVANPVAVVKAVSADGRIVVGSGNPADVDEPLIRWTAGNVESLGGSNALGQDLSDDGAIVVGQFVSPFSLDIRAFRWFEGSFLDLGALAPGPGVSAAFGCSADGGIVVGETQVNATLFHAFRWQGGTMVDLGTIESEIGSSAAIKCSSDGAVIVGHSWNGSRFRACRFSTPGAAIDLGGFDAGFESYASAVSPDGTFIVGYAYLPSGELHAFDLSDEFGFFDLGNVDGVVGDSLAYAVSTNGQVTVGQSVNDGRTGGQATVWFNANERQLWDLLENDYGLDLHGWTEFYYVSDVSADGNTFVGVGRGFGSNSVPFRVTITPNSPPVVFAAGATSVESQGAFTRVDLSCYVSDPDPSPNLIVKFFVGDALRGVAFGVDPAPSERIFPDSFDEGTYAIRFEVTDGTATSSTESTLTISDTTVPIVIVASDVVRPVDKGEIFATIDLTPPSVTDLGDPAPTIVSDAPAKFPIGTTKVLWIVTDDDGNVASATQRVTVTNAAPKANAGVDLVRKTSKASVVVKLNGSKSSDPDQHTLKYKWTAAPATKLTNSTTSKPTGTFKVGTTKVTLTVVDEAGLRSTDTMNVKVQKVRKARKRAANADSAVRESYAAGAKANGKGKASAASAVGLASSAQAYVLGALAGDNLGAKGSPAAGDLGTYVTLRSQQAAASQRAARSFWDAYFLSGRQDALEASLYAHAAGAYALGDTAGSEYSEVLSVRVE